MPVTRLLALLLIALSAGPAFAARWDTYNNASNLNSVRALSGTVWMASDLGVQRYDPGTTKFTRVAKSSGGLASNTVAEIETDATGTWFATKGKGASVLLANGAWRTLNAFDGLPSDTVTALEPSPQGMWVGTRRGLALFDGFTLTAVWPDGVNPSPFASDVINDIAHVGDSTYVATNNGVYVTKTTEGVTWFRRAAGLANLTVTSIKGFGTDVWCVAGGDVYRGGQTGAWTLAEDGLGGAAATMTARNGQLFVGGLDGVYRWDGTASWQRLGGGFPVRAWVDVDGSGNLFAGNFEGLWLWNGTGWLLTHAPGPSGNWVQGMQLTGSTLWITTRDLGMSRFDGTTWRNYYPTGAASRDTTFLIPNTLFGLLADRDGTVWAGQWGQSVAHVDGSHEPPSFDHFYDSQEAGFDNRNTFLWSSALDNNGNRWFGYDTPNLGVVTPVGINEIKTDGTRTNYSPPAQAMSGPQIRALAFAPGPSFELWVAYARSGVDVFTDPTLNTRLDHLQQATACPSCIPPVLPGLLDNDAWGIEFNGDDVWIATSNGLTRWSRSTRRRLESVTTAPPSSQGAIHPLSIDAEGGVWWATSSGLLHRRPNRSVEVFTSDNSPLLTNDVHSVIVDKATGDVWIGTVLGVNRYSPSGSSGPTTPIADGASFNVYPNPAFQSVTGVVLRTHELAGPFKGKVFDVHGRVVRELLGNATTGVVWDGLNQFGSRVAPGVYFLQVKVGDVTRKSRVFLFR